MQGSPSDPGVIPRVVKVRPDPTIPFSILTQPNHNVGCVVGIVVGLQHIFLKKSRLRKSSLKISFSYVEILCEEIYDLLIQRKGAEVRTQIHSTLFQNNLSQTSAPLFCLGDAYDRKEKES